MLWVRSCIRVIVTLPLDEQATKNGRSASKGPETLARIPLAGVLHDLCKRCSAPVHPETALTFTWAGLTEWVWKRRPGVPIPIALEGI